MSSHRRGQNSRYKDEAVMESGEFDHYQDTGCEESPTCLACPLPQCKYDVPLTIKQVAKKQAKDILLTEYVAAHSRWGAAAYFGVGVRTVDRAIKRMR